MSYPNMNVILIWSLWINWLNDSIMNRYQISAFQKLYMSPLAPAIWSNLGMFTFGLGPSTLINQLPCKLQSLKSHLSHWNTKREIFLSCLSVWIALLWFHIFLLVCPLPVSKFCCLLYLFCPSFSFNHSHVHIMWLLFGLHGADDPLHSAEGNLMLQIFERRFLT